jgi:peptidase E
MNLILTSDFPATTNDLVVAQLRAVASHPRIAWIADRTDRDGAMFREALDRFGALGFTQLEAVDIDEQRDDVQIAYLHEFEVLYLTGGDALRFRYNAMRTGLAGRLRQCADLGRLIIGAGAGAMLLTPNVSLSRLPQEVTAEVIDSRLRFEALGAVAYEVLPHSERWGEAVSAKVREYSRRVDNDIVGLADGSALFPTGPDTFSSVGTVTRYRNGTIIEP